MPADHQVEVIVKSIFRRDDVYLHCMLKARLLHRIQRNFTDVSGVEFVDALCDAVLLDQRFFLCGGGKVGYQWS